MARPRRSYGSRQPSQKQRRANAVLLVTRCTPERLRAMTPQEVANSTGVQLAEAETMLAAARIGRGL